MAAERGPVAAPFGGVGPSEVMSLLCAAPSRTRHIHGQRKGTGTGIVTRTSLERIMWQSPLSRSRELLWGPIEPLIICISE